VDEHWQSPEPNDGAGSSFPPSAPAGANLDDLQRMQGELWSALRREDDPDLRMQLLSRLSENRAAILGLAEPERSTASAPAPQRRIGRHDQTPLVPINALPEGNTNPFGSFDDDSTADAGMEGGFSRRASSYTYPEASRTRYRMGAGNIGGDDPAADLPSAFPLSPSVIPDGPPSIPPPPGGGDLVGSRSQRLAARRSVGPDHAGARTAVRLKAGLNNAQAGQRVLVLAGALLSVLGVAWLVLAQPFGGSGETSASGSAAATEISTDIAGDTAGILAVLQSLGLNGVTVDKRADGIHLIGTVPTEARKAEAVSVTETMAGPGTPVVSELVVAGTVTSQVAVADDAAAAKAAAMQSEIDRVVAATPLIFETGKTDLSELQVRILNNVASILKAYPGIAVKVIGYTDHVGSDNANVALSSARAANVKAYLVSQGVSEAGLITEARGSSNSTGSADLASLERRVGFEVVTVPAAAPPATKALLRIAVVAPSARNDLAFTQSMVDAINIIATERGNVEVAITDSTFVPAEAAAATRKYAEAGYNLIIAHGVEFGPELIEIVKAHPDVVFAWGTATDTFGLPNLYAYDAAAEQGGYVMGAMAAQLSVKGTVGVIGPIEVADAKRYVEGFKRGAVAEQPALKVPVRYTGSFGDIALASEAATAHLGAGADVLTGTAEMVVGAIQVAHDNHALWFGTQANQTTLAPDIVVASQVYHWEVLLRPIVADIDGGTPSGRGLVATLTDGGLVVEYNPAFPLPEPVKQRAEQLMADIKSGALVVPGP
jgi:basic membrane protein A and related proteins